jgi:hypothetical protein
MVADRSIAGGNGQEAATTWVSVRSLQQEVPNLGLFVAMGFETAWDEARRSDRSDLGIERNLLAAPRPSRR